MLKKMLFQGARIGTIYIGGGALLLCWCFALIYDPSHFFVYDVFIQILVIGSLFIVVGVFVGIVLGIVFYKFQHDKSTYVKICLVLFGVLIIGVLAAFAAFGGKYLPSLALDDQQLAYMFFLISCLTPGVLLWTSIYFLSKYMFDKFQQTVFKSQAILEKDVADPSS